MINVPRLELYWVSYFLHSFRFQRRFRFSSLTTPVRTLARSEPTTGGLRPLRWILARPPPHARPARAPRAARHARSGPHGRTPVSTRPRRAVPPAGRAPSPRAQSLVSHTLISSSHISCFMVPAAQTRPDPIGGSRIADDPLYIPVSHTLLYTEHHTTHARNLLVLTQPGINHRLSSAQSPSASPHPTEAACHGHQYPNGLWLPRAWELMGGFVVRRWKEQVTSDGSFWVGCVSGHVPHLASAPWRRHAVNFPPPPLVRLPMHEHRRG